MYITFLRKTSDHSPAGGLCRPAASSPDLMLAAYVVEAVVEAVVDLKVWPALFNLPLSKR
jgi:hypothetical protein